jgi:hypothetical protein
MGQLAVIGDKLFMYDNVRGKWLSTETTALQYNKGDVLTDAPLRFGGDLRVNTSGPIMPFNGTIVYATAMSAAGNTTKPFEIRVRNGSTTRSVHTVTYTTRQLNEHNLNIDFNAGDYITVFVTNTGSAIEDTAFVVWVKWRS